MLGYLSQILDYWNDPQELAQKQTAGLTAIKAVENITLNYMLLVISLPVL